jgi:phosphate:Na+ symporter
MGSQLLSGLSTNSIFTLVYSLFFILGGVVVFMIGMEMMGANLEKAAGKSMRRIMSKAAKNRFTGVCTGAAVTAIVNSSAATTVMIVGFVNVGLMTLTQASSLIMGANIGTTISAFIISLSSAGGANIQIGAVFAIIAFGGLVVNMVGKTDRIKRVGNILIGIGLIFIGLHTISGAVSDMTSDADIHEVINNLFIGIGKGVETLTWQIPVLFLLGAVLTALMQSSAALTAIVITLASQGLISFAMAMFITMGANVGTCLTSLISSLSGNTNAKRTAMIHLLFNVIGSLIFIIPLGICNRQISIIFENMPIETQWQIALFHMAFNLITTALLLPFQKYLVKLACLIVPERKGKQGEEEPTEILDSRLLKSPPIAVGQTRKEILKMGDLAFQNYKRSLDMLLTRDISEQDTFNKTEEEINRLNKYITSFCVKLSAQEISELDERKVSSFYHVVSDIERIGDYAENITEYTETLIRDNLSFTDEAKAEVREMDFHITKLYENVTKVFADRDLSYVPAVEEHEAETDRMKALMKTTHIKRVSEGKCDAETGAVFLQLAADMERIGDHLHNISNSVKEYTKPV